MVGYVSKDAPRRAMSARFWIALCFVMPGGIGAVLYFLLRQPEVSRCPSCSTHVQSDFHFCPQCDYQLTASCGHCFRTVRASDQFCTRCGHELAARPHAGAAAGDGRVARTGCCAHSRGLPTIKLHCLPPRMTLSALIIDDEQLAREELAYLLAQVGGVEVVAQGANGIEAVELIEEHHPDMVFLDVQMPGLDGFAVIQRLMDAPGESRHRRGRRQMPSRCRRSSLPRPMTSTRCAPST